jgi:hypothetical protein
MSIYSRMLGTLATVALIAGFFALRSGENETYGNALFFSGMLLWFVGAVLAIAWAVERFYRSTDTARPPAPGGEDPETHRKTKTLKGAA